MKQALIDNIKNIPGWSTKRKIIVFSVDDYGNVRLHSKEAREILDNKGIQISSRFDKYDSLETKKDLELLFDTLHSVKDKNGHSAIFSPFSVPCNIDFEAIIENDSKKYVYELLPVTFEKLKAIDPTAYSGTWELWKEGIKMGIFQPAFHGREHLNVTVFTKKLQQNDEELSEVLKTRSYTSISKDISNTTNYTAAFDFWDREENKTLSAILKDGILQFKKVFGSTPLIFMPPTSIIDDVHLPILKEFGILALDANLIQKKPKGYGGYSRTINYIGKKLPKKPFVMVRNVVFEPTANANFDSVGLALQQIEAAFRWSKPAIISSHRVNFCGHIDIDNREFGIKSLKKLLTAIINKWPDVEFMSINTLVETISKKSN